MTLIWLSLCLQFMEKNHRRASKLGKKYSKIKGMFLIGTVIQLLFMTENAFWTKSKDTLICAEETTSLKNNTRDMSLIKKTYSLLI